MVTQNVVLGPITQLQVDPNLVEITIQKLRELATWIHAIVMKVLQTLFPWIFHDDSFQRVQHVSAPGIEPVNAVLKSQQKDLSPMIQSERVEPLVLVEQQQQQQPVEQQPLGQEELPVVFAEEPVQLPEEEVEGLPDREEKQESEASSEEDKFITIEELLGVNKHQEDQPSAASDEEEDGWISFDEFLKQLDQPFR